MKLRQLGPHSHYHMLGSYTVIHLRYRKGAKVISWKIMKRKDFLRETFQDCFVLNSKEGAKLGIQQCVFGCQN